MNTRGRRRGGSTRTSSECENGQSLGIGLLAVQYEPVFSAAEEAVDIGWAASPEIDCMETREVGRDAVNIPAFLALFVGMVNRNRAVEKPNPFAAYRLVTLPDLRVPLGDARVILTNRREIRRLS